MAHITYTDGTLEGFAVTWLLAGVFMWIGAHLARVHNSGFGRSLVAASAASLVTLLCAEICSEVTGMGAVAGIVVGLVLSWWVISRVYGTSLGDACLVWICNAAANAVAFFFGMTVVGVRVGSVRFW